MAKLSMEDYAAMISYDQQAFTEECFLQCSPGDEYLPNWHVDCIIEHLQAVEEGDIRNLIINMPPRSLKSVAISIAWPAWLLGKNPSEQIIVASYARNIGIELSRKCLKVMQSPIYKKAFPGTRLAKETEEWFTTQDMGHRFVATNGKSPTGFGANYLIMDDIINPAESLSDTIRVKTNDWMTGTLFPRANDMNKVKKVLVMQRLHTDDPTGHLLEKEGWHHLSLPVEFKAKTMIEMRGVTWEKEAGEWLHPERINQDTMDMMATEGMTPYQIAGQFYQTPVPPDGSEFKPQWIQYHENRSWRGMNGYILYDPANTKKKRTGHDPDWSVFFVVALANDNNYYIADIVRDRMNPQERVQTLMKLHRKWNAKFGKPPKVAVEQYGMMTDAFYIQEAQNQESYRFPLVKVGGTMKKEDRIRQLIPLFTHGRVYLPKSLPYVTLAGERVDLVEEFIKEYDTFPLGRHDDIMDSFARIVDPDVNAIFPRVPEYEYHTANESEEDFNPNDFRTW
jgi:predicted phage terminase large subunit-like protein